MSISRIQITGLNDSINLDLRLEHKHCILVGPNGSGKSTTLQIIACALGRQFRELSTLNFHSIEFTWGEVSAKLTRQACEAMATRTRPVPSFFTDRLIRQGLYDEFLVADLKAPRAAERFADLRIKWSDLERIQSEIIGKSGKRGAEQEVKAFGAMMDEVSSPPVRYFPTSRRIEIELAKLFHSAPDYVKEAARASLVTRVGPYYEQIVRFGMSDIDAIFKQFEGRIQDESRNRFNAMLSTLLKETANKESISIKELRDRNITPERIAQVLGRIEESTLNQTEVEKIKKVVAHLSVPRKGGGNPPFHMKWLAHFFVRLLDVDSELAQIEAPVIRLVNALSRYLSPKLARYDNEKYEISIIAEDQRRIDLSMLSSGEKQLVSILTMLELSEQRAIVCIDEPELSLSVPWQLTLLSDMVQTENCAQLFAVTHSPFVYDNDLIDCVLDFQDCVVN